MRSFQKDRIILNMSMDIMKMLYLLVSIFYTYHFIWYLIGLGMQNQKERKLNMECKNRFAILVPAHNEQNVIRNSIRSIKRCDYDRNKYDIYVIADNCTDETVEIAKNEGAFVLSRVSQKRGKQHAIKWALEKICFGLYDAVIVLDADNTVDPLILKVFDNELEKGHKIIQGYVETQNPCDSWITANYAYIFQYVNRVNMARSELGFSSWLAGTGFCISTDILKRIGFHLETLTDDVEYTCKLILNGERVKFSGDAIVYDQKPVVLKDSLRQRLRWIRGQTHVSIKYIPKLILKIFKDYIEFNVKGIFQAIDAIMWVPMNVIILLSVILSLNLLGFKYLINVIISVPVFYILVLISEKVLHYKYWKYLITSGFFFLTWVPITVLGVISFDNKEWWRTPKK